MTRIALCVTAIVFFLPHTTFAQTGFLFRQPRASVGLKVGYIIPSVDSELFDFSREEFTLEKADFNSPYIGGEVAVAVSERLALVGELGWSRSEPRSEYRDFVDQDGLPIEQVTTFERTGLLFGARYYLTDRGRSVGQFAWVPRRVAPYIGGGVGVMWYEFVQAGEFIDFETFEIFSDRIQTSESSPTVDIRAGLDVSLGRRVVLSGESRYGFGSAPTGDDFVGFDDLDLSGLSLLFGVSLRF